MVTVQPEAALKRLYPADIRKNAGYLLSVSGLEDNPENKAMTCWLVNAAEWTYTNIQPEDGSKLLVQFAADSLDKFSDSIRSRCLEGLQDLGLLDLDSIDAAAAAAAADPEVLGKVRAAIAADLGSRAAVKDVETLENGKYQEFTYNGSFHKMSEIDNLMKVILGIESRIASLQRKESAEGLTGEETAAKQAAAEELEREQAQLGDMLKADSRAENYYLARLQRMEQEEEKIEEEIQAATADAKTYNEIMTARQEARAAMRAAEAEAAEAEAAEAAERAERMRERSRQRIADNVIFAAYDEETAEELAAADMLSVPVLAMEDAKQEYVQARKAAAVAAVRESRESRESKERQQLEDRRKQQREREAHNAVWNADYRQTFISRFEILQLENPFAVFVPPPDLVRKIPEETRKKLNIFNLAETEKALLMESDLTVAEIEQALAYPFRIALGGDDYRFDGYADIELMMAFNRKAIDADKEYSNALEQLKDLNRKLPDLKSELFYLCKEYRKSSEKLQELQTLQEEIRKEETKLQTLIIFRFPVAAVNLQGVHQDVLNKYIDGYSAKIRSYAADLTAEAREAVPAEIWIRFMESQEYDRLTALHDTAIVWLQDHVKETEAKAEEKRQELEKCKEEISRLDKFVNSNGSRQRLQLTDVSAAIYRAAVIMVNATLRSKYDYTRVTAVSNGKHKDVSWSSNIDSAKDKAKITGAAEPEGIVNGQPEGGRAAASQAYFSRLKSELYTAVKGLEFGYNGSLLDNDIGAAAVNQFIVGVTLPDSFDMLHEAAAALLEEADKALQPENGSYFRNWLEQNGTEAHPIKRVFKDGEVIRESYRTPISSVYSALHGYVDRQKQLFDPVNRKGTYISLADFQEYRSLLESEGKEYDPTAAAAAGLEDVYIKISDYDLDLTDGSNGFPAMNSWQGLDLLAMILKAKLTAEERTAVEMKLGGCSNRAIAAELEVRENQVTRLFAKIGRKVIKENGLKTKHISSIKKAAKKQRQDNRKKAVGCYSLDGQTLITVYGSAAQACKALNVSSSHVYEVLNGKRQSEHGYIFKYITV